MTAFTTVKRAVFAPMPSVCKAVKPTHCHAEAKRRAPRQQVASQALRRLLRLFSHNDGDANITLAS